MENWINGVLGGLNGGAVAVEIHVSLIRFSSGFSTTIYVSLLRLFRLLRC